jgi:xanthine dehydrogenase accessory factor
MNRADGIPDNISSRKTSGEAFKMATVSTQGRGDESALLAALAVDVDYAAFVGSRKKAEALKAALAKHGVAAERLNKLKAPRGLDLGAITPDEIAISILAEIVAVRRGKGSRGGAAHGA